MHDATTMPNEVNWVLDANFGDACFCHILREELLEDTCRQKEMQSFGIGHVSRFKSCMSCMHLLVHDFQHTSFLTIGSLFTLKSAFNTMCHGIHLG